MLLSIPSSWKVDPPHLLVVGDGSFSRALELVLSAARIGVDELFSKPMAGDSFPRVWGEVETVILVGNGMGAGEWMRAHDAFWEWMERLAACGEEQAVRILWVLWDQGAVRLEEEIRLALALGASDAEQAGHGFVRMAEGLEALLKRAVRIVPADFLATKSRRFGDRRNGALARFLRAASDGGDERVRAAARDVQEAFEGKLHHLDLYCRPPCHPNGNRLRGLLARIVTGEVTPDGRDALESELRYLLS